MPVMFHDHFCWFGYIVLLSFPYRPCIMLFQFNCLTIKNTNKANKFPPRVTGGKWGMGAHGSLDGVDQRSGCWSGSRG